jgi:hypothetical protein
VQHRLLALKLFAQSVVAACKQWSERYAKPDFLTIAQSQAWWLAAPPAAYCLSVQKLLVDRYRVVRPAMRHPGHRPEGGTCEILENERQRL